MSPSPPWRTAFVMTSLITRRRSAIRGVATKGSASAITRSRARGTECGSGGTRNVCFSIAPIAAPDPIGAEAYRSARRPRNRRGAAWPASGRRRRGCNTRYRSDEQPDVAAQRRGRAARPRSLGRRRRRDRRRDHVDVLDTTIVNVALETLSRLARRLAEHDPVGLDRLHAGPRGRHPAHRVDVRALRREEGLDGLGRPVRARLGAVRPGLVVGLADLL